MSSPEKRVNRQAGPEEDLRSPEKGDLAKKNERLLKILGGVKRGLDEAKDELLKGAQRLEEKIIKTQGKGAGPEGKLEELRLFQERAVGSKGEAFLKNLIPLTRQLDTLERETLINEPRETSRPEWPKEKEAGDFELMKKSLELAKNELLVRVETLDQGLQDRLDKEKEVYDLLKQAYTKIDIGSSVVDVSIRRADSAVEFQAKIKEFEERISGLKPLEFLEQVSTLHDKLSELKTEVEVITIPWDSSIIDFFRKVAEKYGTNPLGEPEEPSEVLRELAEKRGFEFLWPGPGDEFKSREYRVFDEKKAKDFRRGLVIRSTVPGLKRNGEVLIKAGIYLAK